MEVGVASLPPLLFEGREVYRIMLDYKNITKQQAIALWNTLVLGMKVDPCLAEIEGFTELKPTSLMLDFFGSLLENRMTIDTITGDVISEQEQERRDIDRYLRAIKNE